MINSSRNMVIAGNWKMNNNRLEAKKLVDELTPLIAGSRCDVVFCVPFTDLDVVVDYVGSSKVKVGAQNCHFEKSGAYTGEISADMLVELGVSHVILGHSERRAFFGETNDTVNLRVKSALDAGLVAIICVGETLKEREDGVTFEVIGAQVKIALKGLSKQEMNRVIIAYEPIWAIGTGKTATADQAEGVCARIRSIVSKIYDSGISESLVVQYGGSVNAKNCAELFKKKNIDGGLIGGASLKAKEFAEIVSIADSLL